MDLKLLTLQSAPQELLNVIANDKDRQIGSQIQYKFENNNSNNKLLHDSMLKVDSKTGIVYTNDLQQFGNVLPANFDIKVNAHDEGGLMSIEPVSFLFF